MKYDLFLYAKDVTVYDAECGQCSNILPPSSEAVGPIPYIAGSRNNAYGKTYITRSHLHFNNIITIIKMVIRQEEQNINGNNIFLTTITKLLSDKKL